MSTSLTSSRMAALAVCSLLLIPGFIAAQTATNPNPSTPPNPVSVPTDTSATVDLGSAPVEMTTMPPTPSPITVNTGAALDRANQARLTNLGANISTRLENTILRLEQINDRLLARQAILSNAGLDTSESNLQLSSARDALAAARSRLATIDSDVARTAGSNNPRESWITLRTTYTSARNDILAAYQAQLAALTTLKNLSTNSPDNATTTNPS